MPYPATKLRPTMPTMLMAAAVAISGVSTTSAPGKYVWAASGWYANQPKEAVAVGAVAMNMITPPSVSTPKLIAAMAALDDSRCMTKRYRSLNGPHPNTPASAALYLFSTDPDVLGYHFAIFPASIVDLGLNMSGVADRDGHIVTRPTMRALPNVIESE